MSISKKSNETIEEINREQVIKKASIKKIIVKGVKYIEFDIISFLLILLSISATIGESVGKSFNFKWYLFLVLLLIVFVTNKIGSFECKEKDSDKLR